MAYTYRRGSTWFVRWKRGKDDYPTVSRDENGNKFTGERAAKKWGEEQEADVRRGLFVDPRSGDVTLDRWVEKWWPAYGQGLALRTRDNYLYCLDVLVLPTFGTSALNAITPVDVATWEQRLRDDGYADNTVRNARARLVTILGDAVTQGMIKSNPALRQRRRGVTRLVEDVEEKVWPTHLQVLLHAERCALLSGRDDDLVFILMLAYTGMRWGEGIGLQREFVRLRNIRVQWQLVERSHFYLLPPKYGSRRTLDVPPFLSDLLSDLVKRQHETLCRCVLAKVDHKEKPCAGGQPHLFLGDQGGHFRASNYRDRVFYPAANGWFPEQDGKRPRPAKPVLVDAAGPWPGLPVPSWPAAVKGAEFAAPRGRGVRRYDPEAAHLASWLPLLKGLTPHGLRHGHQVWMDDLGTPEVLQAERMGHKIGGVRGVYKHVSVQARDELKEGLQRLWKESLAARAAIAPHSPVPIIDALLEPYRATGQTKFSRRIRANKVRALSG